MDTFVYIHELSESYDFNAMKIGLIGAGGMIGSALYHNFYDVHDVKIIKSASLYLPASELAAQLEGLDILINLAGHPVNGRWTSAKKNEIFNSRINTVRNMVDALRLLTLKPKHIINASAIGIYADGVTADEGSINYSDNFLAFVVKNWETEIKRLAEINLNFSIIRIGVVISPKGGFYPKISSLFKFGLGGKMGSGNQGFSFIWIDDLVEAVNFIINIKLFGVVNLVCPEATTNTEFTRTLAKFFNKPTFLNIPEFVLKILLNEGASIILEGQKVYPKRLIDEGFTFKAKNLAECLRFVEK